MESHQSKAVLDEQPMHLRLLGARLMHLLRLIRDSALPVYQRRIGYNELQRQIITMIGHFGPLGSHELVVLTGQEKAQISRAVKALERDEAIVRQSLRAKLHLAQTGEEAFATIMALGKERDAALTAGLSPEERAGLVATTRLLVRRAAELYAEERCLSAERDGGGEPSAAPPAFPAKVDERPLDGLVVPQVISLVSYLKRGAMLAYQREHGLSNFQWQILSLIGEFSPLGLARLIETMDRDKSQVGRTVAYLQENGLVERQRVAGKRTIMLETTPRGARIYEEMCAIALRRDAMLTDQLSAAQRAAYLTMIDRLSNNARVLAAQEAARLANAGEATARHG